MNGPLYSLPLLRLAAEGAAYGPLSAGILAPPAVRVERISRICGSRIIVDVEADEAGCVRAYGHQVAACALGQAAAALLARSVIGHDAPVITTARNALARWLAGDEILETGWPGLDRLAAARDHPARHASILLPFDAVLAALAQIEAMAR